MSVIVFPSQNRYQRLVFGVNFFCNNCLLLLLTFINMRRDPQLSKYTSSAKITLTQHFDSTICTARIQTFTFFVSVTRTYEEDVPDYMIPSHYLYTETETESTTLLPYIDPSTPSNVTVIKGKTAMLACVVRNVGKAAVSWGPFSIF